MYIPSLLLQSRAIDDDTDIMIESILFKLDLLENSVKTLQKNTVSLIESVRTLVEHSAEDNHCELSGRGVATIELAHEHAKQAFENARVLTDLIYATQGRR